MFGKSYEYELKVGGMHCGHCAKRIEDALKQIKEVKKAAANHESGLVKVVCKKELGEEALKNAITNLGYEVL